MPLPCRGGCQCRWLALKHLYTGPQSQALSLSKAGQSDAMVKMQVVSCASDHTPVIQLVPNAHNLRYGSINWILKPP
jgi:hypothetical protein